MNFKEKIIGVFRARNSDYYYGSNDYYNKNFFDKYSSPYTLIESIEINNNISFKTSLEIKFGGTVNFEESLKEVKINLGKPLIKYNNEEIEGHTVILYKWLIGNHKTDVELHFYNNMFFMGTYTFNYLKKQADMKKIEKILFEKYGVSSSDISNIDSPKIVDNLNNSISVENDFLYTIKYLSGNQSIVKSIKDALKSFIEKELEKENLTEKQIEKLL